MDGTTQLDRASYLGGSDTAAILGVSPWVTPVDCFFKKMGMEPPVDAAKEKIFKRGRRIEPLIIDMLIEDIGVRVTKRSTEQAPNRYTDPQHDFLRAEIDFEWEVTEDIVALYPSIPAHLIGTIQNGECKSCHPFAAEKYGESGTDELPLEYFAQAMHGLMVTGREITLFGVLIGTDNLCIYVAHRDEETILGLRQKEVAFWTNHVLARVPPEPIVLEDVYRLMRRDVDIIAEATEDIVELIGKFNAAKQLARSADAQADELKFQIGKWLLGDGFDTMPTRKPKHVIVSDGDPLLTVAYQEQNRVDTDALRKRHPEIAVECSKTSKFYRFDSPRKGSKR